MSVLQYGNLTGIYKVVLMSVDVCVAVWESNGDLQGGADVC